MMATGVHRSFWNVSTPDSVQLATLPFSHVTGMTGSMNSPIYAGSTSVIMTRWDRNVAAALTGLDYIEGYGFSETMAATHINPPDKPKPQCLGIPVFDVDSRIVDVESFTELGPNEVGEIVFNGPQVTVGYRNRPAETKAAFIELDGKRLPHRRPGLL
jgi:fatty-acyl-CoA synthase